MDLKSSFVTCLMLMMMTSGRLNFQNFGQKLNQEKSLGLFILPQKQSIANMDWVYNSLGCSQ